MAQSSEVLHANEKVLPACLIRTLDAYGHRSGVDRSARLRASGFAVVLATKSPHHPILNFEIRECSPGRGAVIQPPPAFSRQHFIPEWVRFPRGKLVECEEWVTSVGQRCLNYHDQHNLRRLAVRSTCRTAGMSPLFSVPRDMSLGQVTDSVRS